MVEKLLPFPTIETERLLLRQVAHGDLDAVFEVASSEDVVRFYSWDAHKTKEEISDFLDSFLPDYETGDCFSWAITPKEGNRFAGLLTARPIFRHNRIALGYWIGRQYWSKGYMTEAVSGLIRYAFANLGVNRVEAEHFVENPASGRVMEKAGMRCEGLLRQHILGRDGIYHDCKVYGISKDQFKT